MELCTEYHQANTFLREIIYVSLIKIYNISKINLPLFENLFPLRFVTCDPNLSYCVLNQYSTKEGAYFTLRPDILEDFPAKLIYAIYNSRIESRK
jgi:hypothetical protein